MADPFSVVLVAAVLAGLLGGTVAGFRLAFRFIDGAATRRGERPPQGAALRFSLWLGDRLDQFSTPPAGETDDDRVPPAGRTDRA